MRPKVKICCIQNIDEANLAIRLGASAIGLVGKMPSGPGPISNQMIKEIASHTPTGIDTFLLTSEILKSKIKDHHDLTRTTTIQLVDDPGSGTYKYLKIHLPDTKIVQVIHVIDESSVENALGISNEVDALLLDSGNPTLSTKILGGTGNTHDWSLSRKIVEQSSIPVFLAGGLRAHNVKQAIDEVQPYGLDLCTGVRTDGQLDPYKLEAFFRAIYD
ncbi:MAG: phosphoribosylanthranilate isomerase [Saprospiraceae bacterium]|nr:phosphoribosylanthranilate isomerase [Saprospiraceae bacterium]